MRRMRTFPAIPQSVPAARRFAVDALSELPARALEAVELMVSELATNCIRHERRSFQVGIQWSDGELRVEVTDSGSGVPRMQSPGPDEPSGRGLQIVNMLSDGWGVEAEAPAGKTVWFTLGTAGGPAALTGDREMVAGRGVRTRGHGGGRPPSVQSSPGAGDGPTARRWRHLAPRRTPVRVRRGAPATQAWPPRGRYLPHDEPGRDAPRRCRPRRGGVG